MQADLGQSTIASPAGSGDPTSPTQTSRKRKAPSSSSRGVATLTPDQLAKKRANDREAQRAIRERTKQTIENLERRIQDLTAQQPYQELQAVIREKDAIQAENNEIRRRLSSILALIQPIVGAQGLTDLASAAQHNVQTGVPQANVFQAESYVTGHQRQYPPALVQGESAYPPFPDGSGDTRNWHTSKDALEQQRDNLRRGLELNETGERLSFNFLLDGIGAGQRPPNPAPVLQQQRRPQAQPSTYYSFSSSPADDQRPWNTLPKHVEPTCPLDSILLDLYRKARRDNSDNNSSTSSQQPPILPSVMSLLNPSQNVDTLSQTMADITTRFPHINTIPNRVAVVWYMFILARWFIYPTQENYECMPEWMRPRSSQLLVPHPAWIDHLPWPLVRDKVTLNHKDYPFDNWFIPYTVGLSVNWPYGPMDCLLSTSENEDPVINPVFEKHIRNLDNWSVGPSFVEAFPALKGTVNVRAQDLSRDPTIEPR